MWTFTQPRIASPPLDGPLCDEGLAWSEGISSCSSPSVQSDIFRMNEVISVVLLRQNLVQQIDPRWMTELFNMQFIGLFLIKLVISVKLRIVSNYRSYEREGQWVDMNTCISTVSQSEIILLDTRYRRRYFTLTVDVVFQADLVMSVGQPLPTFNIPLGTCIYWDPRIS